MEGLANLWRSRGMTIEVQTGMLECIVGPTVLYELESWVLNARERRMGEVFNIKCLKKMSSGNA